MTKDKVRELLSGGEFVSGEAMSQTLQVSRAAVWKAVKALRAEGYDIQSVTNKGYCLQSAPKSLHLETILGLLQGHPWTSSVQVLDEVSSTNTLAKQLAADGAPHGTVLVADCQTAGRGRLGRSFASPAGVGLYLSVILRPQVPPMELLHLTAMSAVATAKAVEQVADLEVGIKWTNDLVVGRHKLAGILTEMSLEAESGTVNYAVVGIGTNCNHKKEDFPEEIQEIATSMAIKQGEPVDRNHYTAALILALAEMYDGLFSQKKPWMAEYADRCITLGKDVQVVRGNSTRLGKALSLDENGGLLVAYEDGTQEYVNSGEVSVRGMYGYV